MEIPQFSFISQSNTDYSLPVRTWTDISFQLSGVVSGPTNIYLKDINGQTLDVTNTSIIRITEGVYHVTPIFNVEVPDCFRLEISISGVLIPIGNLFTKDSSKYTSRITYICDSNEFGFIYNSSSNVNRVRLPFYLKEPQYPQTEEIYKKFSGKRVVLGATIDEEWLLETDYMSDELHKKLIIALSHDSVWIDNVLVTKSENYSIDWSNTRVINGIKAAKATCRVQANVTYRNSNVGSSYDDDVFDVQPRLLSFEAA